MNGLRGLAFACGLLGACAGAKPPPPPSEPPLRLAPLVDLAPAASLAWLIEVHPRAITLDGRLVPYVTRVVPEERLQSFAKGSGGIDLREADEVLLAGYPEATLTLVREVLDPRRVEQAFVTRLTSIAGRSVDRTARSPSGSVTRLWGITAGKPEQLVIFGVEAAGLEQGRFGPLRAAELFAEARLKRASPALKAPPLDRVAALLGEGPLRAFAPGPFQGGLEHAAGGLLGACTAVGARAKVDSGAGGVPVLTLRGVLLGAWGSGPDAEAARLRLRSLLDMLAMSSLGRLLGLDHPILGPAVSVTPDALTLEVTLDAGRLADGVRAATAAEIDEMMGQ